MVEDLFPRRAEHSVPLATEAEMGAAVPRICAKTTGVPNRVLALIFDHPRPRLKGLYDACLVSGQFPGCPLGSLPP